MSLTSVAGPEIEAENGIQGYIDEFDLPFEEEDFEAIGVNPIQPTGARPGSEEKVTMLAARYAAGLPLWHNSDCYDHGPGEVDSSIEEVEEEEE